MYERDTAKQEMRVNERGNGGEKRGDVREKWWKEERGCKGEMVERREGRKDNSTNYKIMFVDGNEKKIEWKEKVSRWSGNA